MCGVGLAHRPQGVHQTGSTPVSTNRDDVVYDFDKERLAKHVEQFADDYNAELHRWKTKAKPPKDPKLFAQYLDGFVNYEKVKWSETLKRHLSDETESKFVKAGKRLAELHVNYEEQPEFPLKRIENKEAKLNWRVETMKLTKDHALLIYNDWLSLAGIPEEVFDYRLGNRSALEWVIDQYRVTRDADAEIVSDPNRLDDEEYIVRLIGQVVYVSVETLKAIGKLPELKFP